MDLYTLNERVYRKCENALDGQEAQKSVSGENYYKAHYSPATLMNDWYEKRVEVEPQVTSSEPFLSEQMDSYRPFCKSTFPDKEIYYTKLFEGYGLGQELLFDQLGFSFYDNYTTTYDLMFNHLPKGICGPYPRKYFRGRYIPETDLTNVFGNLTKWGIREIALEKSKPVIEKENVFLTETAAEYVCHDLREVKKENDFPNFKRRKLKI